MRASYDVVVVGLGVLGSAAARALAGRGLSVLGLDRYRPPHARGSSHGGTRILRRVYAEGAFYVPLLERSDQLWRELERRSGRELLLERGCLILGEPGSELIESSLRCAREHGLEHEPLDAAGLERRFPALAVPDRTLGIFDPRAGVLRAEECVRALLEEAAAAGADLRFDCPVDSWKVAGGGVEVTCSAGRPRAARLIAATGAWLADLPAAAGLELAVERQVQHWFEPADDAPRVAELPAVLWQVGPRLTWYALPDLGEGLKAGIHHGGERVGVETVRRQVTAAEQEEVRRLLARYLPRAAGPCRASEVCLYTNTPDLRFVAGPLPAEPRVWLLGGGSGHAFKFAPGLAELVAEGIDGPVDGSAAPRLSPFLPSRPGR